MTDDPLIWVRAAHVEAEQLANDAARHCGALVAREASRDGQWTPPYDGSGWASDADHVYVSDPRAGQPKKVPIADFGYGAFGLTGHIQNNSPAAVLRRIAADRKLIGEYEITIKLRDEAAVRVKAAKDYPDAKDLDTWCRAQAELSVMDGWIRLIAEGWGWTEETT